MKVLEVLLFSVLIASITPQLLPGQGFSLCVVEAQKKTLQSCANSTVSSTGSYSLPYEQSVRTPSKSQLRIYGLAAGILGTGISAVIIPEISPIVGTFALVETIHLSAGQHGNLLGEFLAATGILAAAIGGGVAVGLATGSNEAVYALWGVGIVLQDFAVVAIELKGLRKSRSIR